MLNSRLIIALILVVLVITLYLGKMADTLIPSIVMPMSIIATFIVMRGYKFTLDNLSLLALTLAVGFIIDDAIVVLENIVRRQEEGENRLQSISRRIKTNQLHYCLDDPFAYRCFSSHASDGWIIRKNIERIRNHSVCCHIDFRSHFPKSYSHALQPLPSPK